MDSKKYCKQLDAICDESIKIHRFKDALDALSLKYSIETTERDVVENKGKENEHGR